MLKITNYIKLARPADWVKNTFVLPAILASGKAGDSQAILHTLLAFIAFCCVASGVYCINDAIDRDEDRRHPVKRKRPIPAGLITPAQAIMAGFIWIIVGLGVSLFVPTAFMGELTLVLITYLVLQTVYNLAFKRVATVDVIILSLGFVLRALGGAVAIGVPASLWLLLCVFFLCLYLALIKRLCDITSRDTSNQMQREFGSQLWESPAGYQSIMELHWMLGVSATLAITAFLLYAMTNNSAPAGNAVRGFVLFTPLVVIAMNRLYYLSSNKSGYDSPLAIILTDATILICTILFVIGVASLFYVQWCQDIIQHFFIL